VYIYIYILRRSLRLYLANTMFSEAKTIIMIIVIITLA
jgi:hypothetical protein